MIVLVSNNSGAEAVRLRDSFPDRVGHLYGPGGWRGPWPIYAIDNGAFSAYKSGIAFRSSKFLSLVEKAAVAPHAPRWLAVPDVVADRDATLENWYRWLPLLKPYEMPLAFVVQDGMTKGDIPSEAAVVFVGGTRTWKWQTLAYWCQHHPRVHVGRVNGQRLLWQAHRAGCESCDGTGWFRGDRQQLDGLWYYLTDSAGLLNDLAHGPMQRRLFAEGAQ